MNKRQWIRDNREEIDRAILSTPGMEGYRLNNRERELWLANDESLYLWARSEGVDV